MKFCCLSVLLFIFSNYGFAQKNSPDTEEDTAVSRVITDSVNSDYALPADTVISRTVFDAANDSIAKWKQTPGFGYMVYLDSLLRKKTNLRIDTFSIDTNSGSRRSNTTFSTNNPNANRILNSFPVQIFFWVIAVFFIGFVVYKLFFTGNLFTKRKRKFNQETAAEEPEKLNEYAAYNLLIYEAESQNDYNLAIRYLYLQSLKRLADRELILFSPDKTNKIYVEELNGRVYQNEFASLTSNYEYVWYGRFAIDGARYHHQKDKFISFNKRV
ncbi:MAG: hypothetical protein ABI472_03935 [Ginsengibacter sp.]